MLTMNECSLCVSCRPYCAHRLQGQHAGQARKPANLSANVGGRVGLLYVLQVLRPVFERGQTASLCVVIVFPRSFACGSACMTLHSHVLFHYLSLYLHRSLGFEMYLFHIPLLLFSAPLRQDSLAVTRVSLLLCLSIFLHPNECARTRRSHVRRHVLLGLHAQDAGARRL